MAGPAAPISVRHEMIDKVSENLNACETFLLILNMRYFLILDVGGVTSGVGGARCTSEYRSGADAVRVGSRTLLLIVKVSCG